MIISLEDYEYGSRPKTRRGGRGGLSWVFETPSGYEVEINHVTPTKWELDGVLYRTKKSALNIFYKSWNSALIALENEFNSMSPEEQEARDSFYEAQMRAEIRAFYPEIADIFGHFVRALEDGELDYAVVEDGDAEDLPKD